MEPQGCKALCAKERRADILREGDLLVEAGGDTPILVPLLDEDEEVLLELDLEVLDVDVDVDVPAAATAAAAAAAAAALAHRVLDAIEVVLGELCGEGEKKVMRTS